MSDASNTGVRRLHPAAALIDFVRRAPASWGSITAVVFVASRDPWLASIAAGIFALISAILAGARWRAFTYSIDASNGLVIDQGLLRRSRRTIPAERIEDVSTEQGPMQRLFGLVRVRIETGGGIVDEGLLDSVSKAEAMRLHGLLRGGEAAASGHVADSRIAAPLFEMTAGRVLLHGLFSFSLLWLAAIFALLQGLERITRFDFREFLDIAEREAFARLSVSSALAAVALVVLLGIAAGVATSFLRDFGFRLTFEDGRFRRVRGLFTRSQTVIVDRRIQVGVVSRGWLSGRLGFAAFEVQTLGGSDGPAGRHELAPFATEPEIAAVLARTPLPRFEASALARVSPVHAPLSALRRIAPWAVVVAVAGWFWPPAWLAMLPMPLLGGFAWHRARHHRYALRDTSLQVANGVTASREWVAPFPSLQSVTVQRTLLQRWFGVASVFVVTAGAGGKVAPDVDNIPGDAARALALSLIARADD